MKKDSEKLKEIKKKLNEFVDEQFKSDYNLLIGSSKEETEIKYHKFQFLKKAKLIDEVLKN